MHSCLMTAKFELLVVLLVLIDFVLRAGAGSRVAMGSWRIILTAGVAFIVEIRLRCRSATEEEHIGVGMRIRCHGFACICMAAVSFQIHVMYSSLRVRLLRFPLLLTWASACLNSI